MAEVRELDAETVARIAAGEVIARPASVVKELVENSLDAGATRVTIAVEGGGIEFIRVADDGHGMVAEDAVRAFDRHTTSKLAGVEGVKAVDTLGFRGEALPSIAAVADVTLTTKAEGEDAVAVRVEGDERETRPAGHRVGTTVELHDLFSKVPARRKALADPKAEFRRVSETVSRYALVRPDVSVRLEHGDRTVLTTPGSGDFADALLGVYDREVAGQSVPVEGGDGEIAVRGRVTTPAVTRSKPDHLRVAVNGRALRNSELRDAAVAGYGNLLPDGRYPVGAIDVELPPERVDANVHPRKERVAFRDANAAGAVETAVGDALATADLARAAETALDLDDSLEAVSEGDTFEGVSVIGQFRDAYLLCERDEELLVLDQHAAHERVNYERLREAIGEMPSVEFDQPATLSLSPGAATTLDAERERVRELGYRVSSFGGDAYRVSAVPAPLGRTAAPESLRDVLDELADGDAEDPRDAALAELACHPSLKAGDELSVGASETLLSELGACEQPYACPHGRPTVLSIEEKSLVSGFERSGRRLG
jgi:DNA mismatch repair protein MutL